MARISELINDMIQKMLESAEWTSANPTHINTLIQVNALENPDFEEEISALIKEEQSDTQTKKELPAQSQDAIKREKRVDLTVKKFNAFNKGNVGAIQRLTSEQFGNVRQLATNPVQFMMGTVFRKLAKGVGVIGLALILMEVVKFIISELLKPGRLLDRRFKRDIEREIFAFRSREEKQKLRQGFNNIIITTIGGLRGGAGQIYSTRGDIANNGSVSNINVGMIQPGTTDLSSGVPLKSGIGRRSGNGPGV